MAFDWIAGTALVVGMGSLYLTYQSTKSAKRAIDTSIELYEKQKQDATHAEEISKKKQLQSLCYLIQNELTSNVIKMSKLVVFFKFVWDGKLVSFNYNNLGSEPIVSYKIKSGHKDAFTFTKHASQIIDKYLFEVSKLDNILIGDLLKLRLTIEYYNDQLDGLMLLISTEPRTNDLIGYIDGLKDFITEYQRQSIGVLEYCTKKSLGI